MCNLKLSTKTTAIFRFLLDNVEKFIFYFLQGKQYTSIESSVDFNDLCVIPNTGLSMMAVEDQKMQIYYVPSLGL